MHLPARTPLVLASLALQLLLAHAPARLHAQVWGDVSRDGTINSADALSVLSYSVGLPAAEHDYGLADVSGEGTISTFDALIILQYTVGIDVSQFRVGQPAGGCPSGPGCEPSEDTEPGGSNYPMYDIGDYLTSPTTSNWYGGELRPVVGTYHLDPGRVASQLQTMCANGQRKIALVIWYMPLSGGAIVHGHLIDSSGGNLRWQHHQNLVDVLDLIAGLCFDEVQIRLAQQGSADPEGWSVWNEAQYAENLAFLVTVRQVAEGALSGDDVRALYDLGLELGGSSEGQASQYTRRLWSDYTARFGKDDTYGFSMIAGSGRFTRMMQAYGANRPESYAVDAYGGVYELLSRLASEMRTAAEIDKPVLIQEAFYNDPLSDDAFDRARDELGLRIRAVMQWPLERGYPTSRHFSMHYPAEYAAYAAEP